MELNYPYEIFEVLNYHFFKYLHIKIKKIAKKNQSNMETYINDMIQMT